MHSCGSSTRVKNNTWYSEGLHKTNEDPAEFLDLLGDKLVQVTAPRMFGLNRVCFLSRETLDPSRTQLLRKPGAKNFGGAFVFRTKSCLLASHTRWLGQAPTQLFNPKLSNPQLLLRGFRTLPIVGASEQHFSVNS